MFLKDFNKTAMILRDQEISYKELIRNVNYYSSILSKNDLSKVAIFCENRLEWAFSFYSVWKKKAISVPIDHMSAASDVAFILNDCKPEVIFYSDSTKDTCYKAAEQLDYKIEKINIDEIKIDQPISDEEFPEPNPNYK